MNRRTLPALSLLAGLIALAPEAPAQSVLQPGDVGVVTTTGFRRLRAAAPQAAPVNETPAAAFGFATLQAPRIAWEPGTDDFLVCTGSSLFRVTVNAAPPVTLTDLSPNLGGPALLRAIDIHPATGELFLHDASSAQVFRFAPPFAAGMTPDLVLPAPGGTRAACLDTRDIPPSMIVATSEATSHLPFDGGDTVPIAFEGASGLDDDPIGHGHTVMVIKKENKIDVSTSTPNLVINLNFVGFCAPIALGPVSVAYDPLGFKTYVLAEDGVNPNCVFGTFGGNHVITFPPASGPILPEVITNPADSGISGSAGSIALVTPDFAFPSPYGSSCAAPSTGDAPKLDANGPPSSPSTFFALELTKLPPGAPVFLLLGTQPLQHSLPSGCTILVAVMIEPFAMGAAGSNGKLELPANLPAGIPVGLQLHLQAALHDSGQVVLTNGLLLHFAP